MSLSKKKEITDRIWTHSKTSGANKLMLFALTELADDDGFCWPSYETLGNMVGLTGNPDSIKRCALNNLAPLIEKNEVIVWKQQGKKGGRGNTNIFLITVGLTDEQIREIVKRRFELQDNEVGSVLTKEGEEYTRLCTDRRVSSEALERTRDPKKGDTSIQPSHPMGDKYITDNGIKGDTSIQGDKAKGDRLAPRSKESLNPESNPNKDNLDSSPNGEVIPVILPEVQTQRIEYTPIQRDFLTYFNAKRFKNPTQAATVLELSAQLGDAEIRSLAEWAADLGMGVGKAINAIKSVARKKQKQNSQPTNEDSTFPQPPDPIPPPDSTPEEDTWQKALTIIQGRVTKATYDQCIKPLVPMGGSNGTFYLLSPTELNPVLVDKTITPAVIQVNHNVYEVKVKLQ